MFVEVKTRSAGSPYHPTAAVTQEKQQRVRLSGEYYLMQHPEPPLQPRFDVVAVTVRGGNGRGSTQVEHYINAF